MGPSRARRCFPKAEKRAGLHLVLFRKLFSAVMTMFLWRWNVECGIAIEETNWFQGKADHLRWHHWPILGPHNMVGPEGIPDHHVTIHQRTILRRIHRQPSTSLLLVRIVSRRVALLRIIGRHPQMVSDKAPALPLWRSLMKEWERISS